LSITYNGVAKAICDDGFGDADAGVACMELFADPSFI
jgi:hypothetical protein